MTRQAFVRALDGPGAPVLLALGALGTLVPVVLAGAPETTDAGASHTARLVALAAGLLLLGTGILVSIERRWRRVGFVAAAAGAAWLAPHWEGWDGGPPVVRSLGALVAPLLLALLFDLALSASSRVRSRAERLTVRVVYVLAALVALGRALFRDPELDPYCWRNCTDNVFLVHAHEPLAHALGEVWLWSNAAFGLALAILAGRRLARATVPARRVFWAVLVAAVAVGLTQAAYAITLLATPLEDPKRGRFSALFVARALALVALGLGLAWAVLKERAKRAAVSSLAVSLAHAPSAGNLRVALAEALGDRQLDVLYHVRSSSGLVDAEGMPAADASSRSGRALTPIVREGKEVALLVHDPGVIDRSGLEHALGPALLLAVENERLRAEVLAQLREVRASRARIVETGDATRRRLERDLHDGAQQRLLAVSYDLRRARTGADPRLAAVLERAAGETHAALDELRTLAQGIFPAVLAEAGLAAALESLAETAPLAVELGALPAERYPAAAENAAYVTVAEGIDSARRRGASVVVVEVLRKGATVVVSVSDDGRAAEAPPVHLADRVGALDGSLELQAGVMRATIPCASS